MESSESILNSVKRGLVGISEDYSVFDSQLIMHINTVLQRLYQLGVGPKEKPFTIADSEATWDQFVDDETMEMAKSYMVLRVRLLFDPPDSSYAIENIKAQIQEFEWLMNVQVDPEDTFLEDS